VDTNMGNMGAEFPEVGSLEGYLYLPEKLRYLHKWIYSDNIAEELSEEELSEIGQQVLRGYEIDKQSRIEWEELMEEALKIAKQVKETKNFPWPNAANVKYPLIVTASIQFASRAYPELIQGYETVRCMVVGEDLTGEKMDKASRIEKHMSWQLVEEIEGWEDDTDRLLHVLPVMGLCYKKVYYDPIKRRICSEFLLPDDVVVHYRAKCLETTRRITQEMEFFKNDIHERIESGIWLDVKDKLPIRQQVEGFEDDEQGPDLFLEQHRWIDLDDDGYDEPYVVTVHKQTGQVVRIIARYDLTGIEVSGRNKIQRITPIKYFTKFSFIPNPDGSFYDLGFGLLITPINESVNTLVNQILDAGTLANMGGGFYARGIRMKSGTIYSRPGEWHPVDTPAMDLRQGIVPHPRHEPSAVLFNLLGLLIEAARDISSVKDILTGEQPGNNVPATTVLALIEQGLKVFSAIYKRIYRSFTKEFKAIFILNSIHLDDETYFRVVDNEAAISKQDYDVGSFDVRPTADPSISSDAQRLAKAQALMAFKGDKGINQDEINQRYLDAIRVPNIERLILPKEEQQADPDPKLLIAQMNHELEKEKLKLEETRLKLEQAALEIDAAKAEGEIARWEAQAYELTKRAHSHEDHDTVQMYRAEIEKLKLELQHEIEKAKLAVEMAKAEVKAYIEAKKSEAKGSK
jgi:chaperonin GroES